MAGINCNIDYTEGSLYDMFIKKDRTLNYSKQAVFCSGDTEYPFQFTDYTGATLQVRKNFDSAYVVLEFSTTDGSIVLGNDGWFTLVKSAEELELIRVSDYKYDMYLSSDTKPKRDFLYGEFIINNRVTI